MSLERQGDRAQRIIFKILETTFLLLVRPQRTEYLYKLTRTDWHAGFTNSNFITSSELNDLLEISFKRVPSARVRGRTFVQESKFPDLNSKNTLGILGHSVKIK